MRVIQLPLYLDVLNTLCAIAVPLAFPELYSALEVKAVDGQENPLGLIETNKFYEVQKYLTLTRHTYSGMAVVMSKKTWDTMSETEHKIIQDSAREAGLEERRLSIENNAKAVETLKKSMQVTELAPAEVARMRQKVQPVVDKYSKEIGEGFVKDAYSELAKIRGG